MIAQPSKESCRRFGKVSALLVLGAAMLVAYTAHGSMPYNAVELPGERDLQTTAWAPESWKFFTRSPQEEQMVAWLKDGEGFRSASLSGASPKFAMGLDRSGRTQGVEVALLLESVPKKAFQSCEDMTPDACLSRMGHVVKVENLTPNPTLCGAVGISMQKPVPWAWARSGRPVVMPSRVLRLEVTC